MNSKLQAAHPYLFLSVLLIRLRMRVCGTVDSRCEQLRQQAEDLARGIQATLRSQLAKLPKSVREMKMSDFMNKYNGDVQAVMKDQVGLHCVNLFSF